jgi:hypothetical protein
MSTVRAQTLLEAYTNLMRVWHLPDAAPAGYALRRDCMRVACELKVAMTGIGITVEEQQDEPLSEHDERSTTTGVGK